MNFVDTSFFFPLLSAHDRDQPRVREVFHGPLIAALRAHGWDVVRAINLYPHPVIHIKP